MDPFHIIGKQILTILSEEQLIEIQKYFLSEDEKILFDKMELVLDELDWRNDFFEYTDKLIFSK